MFEAYFHRTVRSSIAFIIGSILERSRVRYYHPALIGGLMTRALYTVPQCSNISKEEHTASNIPKPGPASTIPTLRRPAPPIPALQRLAPPSYSKLPRSLHHASAHFWSWPWSGMCSCQSENRISRKQPSTENKSSLQSAPESN